MMSKTVADLLVERLIAWNVEVIFGFPGDGVNGIFGALRRHKDKLRFIQVRHEEAAAFAACGYAKFTGRLGVCIATSGPGGIHLFEPTAAGSSRGRTHRVSQAEFFYAGGDLSIRCTIMSPAHC